MTEGVKPANSNSLIGTEAAIKQISEYLANEYREYFEEEGINATFSLSQSIAPEIVIDDTKVQIKIGADKYFDFIDEGVNGVFKNRNSPYSYTSLKSSKKRIESFKKYIQTGKPILRANAPKDLEGAAYYLATATKKFGIKPKNIQDSLITDDLIEKVSNIYLDALERAVDLYFESIEKDNGNNNR